MDDLFFSSFNFHKGREVFSRWETTIRSGRSWVRVLAGEKFFFLLQIIKTDSGTRLTSHSVGMGFFPALQRPVSEADRSSPSRTEVKNEWNIPLPPLYTLMAWKGTNVTFLCLYCARNERRWNFNGELPSVESLSVILNHTELSYQPTSSM